MTEYHLQTPLSGEDVEKLVAGDVVFLSGPLFTARDKAHALIRRTGCPVSLQGAALYHCGPLIKDDRVLSAGPTTSSRMARYTDDILRLGVKAIIGKGGLPGEPFRGKAVYLAYPGGCGAAAAQQLKVLGVQLPELGMAESLWEFEARDFGPMIVAVDARGKDLYQEVRRSAQKQEMD
ncbi:MAG: fumarate hydratase C-terminal domain-containing protein [Methanothrix sp.]|jgi:fumarate hydratase subunit beta|nr:fumarate hydratase C-terminal domain-containing protein [Methanothrix sp.]